MTLPSVAPAAVDTRPAFALSDEHPVPSAEFPWHKGHEGSPVTQTYYKWLTTQHPLTIWGTIQLLQAAYAWQKDRVDTLQRSVDEWYARWDLTPADFVDYPYLAPEVLGQVVFYLTTEVGATISLAWEYVAGIEGPIELPRVSLEEHPALFRFLEWLEKTFVQLQSFQKVASRKALLHKPEGTSAALGHAKDREWCIYVDPESSERRKERAAKNAAVGQTNNIIALFSNEQMIAAVRAAARALPDAA